MKKNNKEIIYITSRFYNFYLYKVKSTLKLNILKLYKSFENHCISNKVLLCKNRYYDLW